MKKHTLIPTTGLLRSTITLFLFTLLAAGMAACNGAKSSDNAQAGNSQTSEAANTSTSDHAAATPEQKAAWKQKREAVRKQVEAVLTPDQVKELEAKLQQGEKMRRAVNSLNLTAEQKTKVQEIFKTAYAHRDKTASEKSTSDAAPSNAQ